jgi:hypothetical protein
MGRRTEIRNQVRNLLLNNTSVGESVYTNPTAPSWVEELPVILIRTMNESIEIFNQAPREYRKTLELTIEAIASGNEVGSEVSGGTLEDLLDKICHEIECVMTKDTSLVGFVSDVIPVSIDFDYESDGNVPIGAAKVIYSLVYYEQLPTPDKVDGINDFLTAEVQIDVGDANVDNVEDDPINIPQV